MWTPLCGLSLFASVARAQYLTGVGIGDITGPVVETNMMGYASLAQMDSGLHMRMRSRAFIVAEAADPSKRFVFVNAEIGFADSGIRRSVIEKLASLYPGVYDDTNVGISGTHSHSGIGGYTENLLPQITSLGFVSETYDAIVEGTVKAIINAHNSLSPGTLSFGTTELLEANINRSPSAYLNNPAVERAQYQHDQDKDMRLVKFMKIDGTPKGFLSFYATHGTSLYENNTLVSGDNKGMAAHLYESYVEPNSAPGNASFVAGFAQSATGDSSPNTLGAFCESPGKSWDGQPCSFNSSTCGGTVEDCHGRGPGFRVSDFESNSIIGSYQFEGAKTIMEQQSLTSISGPVKAVHTYVDMTQYGFKLANGTTVHTCPPAMGYSFAAGTTDGPGAFDFTQGDTSTNPFWEIIKSAITPLPNDQQKACHAPKPILLNTGFATLPYDWQPKFVNVQMFRVGQIVILMAPGELTTMAGRRLRAAIQSSLASKGVIGNDSIVLIAGLSNTYGHYITTREEYAIQRYEGASTIYGPFTLEAYMDIYSNLVPYLSESSTTAPPTAPAPPDNTKDPLSLRTGVVLDNVPPGTNFGKALTQPSATYSRGLQVSVKFQGANPRNNFRQGGTFLTVERQVSSTWVTYRTDGHPSTKYHWLRTNGFLGYSEVTITWDIESDAPPGTYRILYYGDYKNGWSGEVIPFTGTSNTFTVS